MFIPDADGALSRSLGRRPGEAGRLAEVEKLPTVERPSGHCEKHTLMAEAGTSGQGGTDECVRRRASRSRPSKKWNDHRGGHSRRRSATLTERGRRSFSRSKTRAGPERDPETKANHEQQESPTKEGREKLVLICIRRKKIEKLRRQPVWWEVGAEGDHRPPNARSDGATEARGEAQPARAGEGGSGGRSPPAKKNRARSAHHIPPHP